MSDQEKSAGSEGDQPLSAPKAKTPATPTNGEITEKKVTRKKTAKKKVAKKKAAKKKVSKKTLGKKKTTVKKTASKKKVTKKKASKKKVAKKVAASGAAARKAEKQAVNNAILAAVSAGGDLMKPSGEDKPSLEGKPSPSDTEEAVQHAEPSEHVSEAELRSEQQQQELSPAEEAAARQVEKKAVNDAILAAVDAGRSLMKPDPAENSLVQTSAQEASQAIPEAKTSAETAQQEPTLDLAQNSTDEPADISTSTSEQAQLSARSEPKPVQATAPGLAAEPARAGSRAKLAKPQTLEAKPKHQGISKRILVIALCLIAAVLLAKILMPEFDFVHLMPEFLEGTPTANEEPAEMRAVPESEMQIILDVFAPELKQE